MILFLGNDIYEFLAIAGSLSTLCCIYSKGETIIRYDSSCRLFINFILL